MAQTNAEIVREFSDLIWSGQDLDAALELVHPEAVFDWSASRGRVWRND